MKKFLIGTLIVIAAVAVGVTVVAAKYQPTIRPNTVVGQVPVGGLTKDEAAKRVRIWWEAEKTKELTLTCDAFKAQIPPMTPSQLGITVDDEASVAPCEVNDFWDAASQKISGDPTRVSFPIKYKSNGAKVDTLKKLIKSSIGPLHPARVTYVAGVIQRTPEVASFQLDESKIYDAVTVALSGNGDVVVPITEAPKKMSDEDLGKIKDVVSEFSTHFPAYQTSRNTNIRLATEKLNGHILMPGEQLSFNHTVGQRTVQDGFRTAPVLKNGKHDTGIGGGICQVSTTLYNATLLSNLKIITRHNHSTPSVYVPVGRDATVDWPDLDLVIENSMTTPIAISSTFESGQITFRILGLKDPTQSVKILTSGFRSWGGSEQVIRDGSLPPGKTQVLERGSSAKSIQVYRVVYKDGQEVKRESLGTSIYPGLKRIVAVSTQKAGPKPGPAGTAVTPVPAGGQPAPDNSNPPPPTTGRDGDGG